MVSRIQQSLSFHDSPESFISSRLQDLSISDPASLPAPGKANIVKASILNRNVHIISSYRLCEAVLKGSVTTDPTHDEDDDASSRRSREQRPTATIQALGEVDKDRAIFAAERAYAQFMSAFFPGPNILLQDGPQHAAHKQIWKQRMKHVVSESSGLEDLIVSLTREQFVEPLVAVRKKTIDLYDAMKSLAWDMLFGIFLGLDRDDDKREFSKMEALQEDLLRGQFSLFPLSIRTRFWSSPKSRGLDAVKSLQAVLAGRLKQIDRSRNGGLKKASACPFMQQPDAGQEADEERLEDVDMVAHLLVFTSSIANKALASLLTAYLLNLFLWQDGNGCSSLAHLIRSQEDQSTKRRMLESILAETERLSPPVVGVMRRVKQDIVLRGGKDRTESEEYSIPNGHDAWLYLAGASRDPEVFEEANSFVWDRYMPDDESQDLGFAFGAGVKLCLGIDLARRICLAVANTVLDCGVSFEGTVADPGVKHWLGWEQGVPLETIAKDLKQLPCQRPRRPVNVEVIVDR